MAASWDYSFVNGPEQWHKNWTIGSKQSPIDIIAKNARYDEALLTTPFRFDESGVITEVKNVGNNISVAYSDSSSGKLILSGGPLQHAYQFKELHMHWGKSNDRGSEHLMNGKSYVAELHLVHWNCDLFPSAAEAVPSEHGLAVLGVFLDVCTNDENDKFETFLSMYEQVPYKGQVYQSTTALSPYSLLPDDRGKYFTYTGSLTTPPCSESVTWTVFADPIKISENQLNRLRCMKAVGEEEREATSFHNPFDRNMNCTCSNVPTIGDNFRPTSDLGCRQVSASFQG